MKQFVALILSTALCWTRTVAYVPSSQRSHDATWLTPNHECAVSRGSRQHHGATPSSLRSSPAGTAESQNQNLLAARSFLQENYPIFYSILETNDEVWKAIGEDDPDKGEYGFTIFAPSDAAMRALGDKKASQLMDPRNLETTQKIAGYHVIGETVSAEQLFNAGGVVTISGEIPIERSKTGGMFGVGGQEDGGLLINKARATQTSQVGTGLVHEVETLVCPNVMWRYMDQLRIPGSN
jgi:uncharacterized surface protein with fasciclin (FAS1) repeats